MKGILLAGGLGTRLYPITRVVNKHLLPLYDRPMFHWPLQTLIDSGIKEIAIVSGPPTGHQIKEALNHFSRKKNINLIFINQDKPLGMPHAIYQCRNFLDQSSFIITVGDNLFSNHFKEEVDSFKTGARAIIRKVNDPSAFGVALLNRKKVLDIIEKPKEYVSNWAVGAPYFFDNTAISKIERLKPSKRGELEIVDLLKLYLKENNLSLIKKTGVWIDTGTPENLLKANNKARKLSLS